MSGFHRAVKHTAKLRMGLAGPAGSGKTWSALAVASGLVPTGRIALIDTEHGAASKYADAFSFDTLELDNFHPSKYIAAIQDAEAADYDVLVIDSLSHAWNGIGGILEMVDRESDKFNKGWAKATPLHNQLIEALLAAKLHLIVTFRSKQEYAQERDERTGRTVVRKLGMAPIQRDGVEYELDVFGDLDYENTLRIQKSRCPALSGQVIAKPGRALAHTLTAWLSGDMVSSDHDADESPTPTANVTPIRQRPSPAPAQAPAAATDPSALDLQARHASSAEQVQLADAIRGLGFAQGAANALLAQVRDSNDSRGALRITAIATGESNITIGEVQQAERVIAGLKQSASAQAAAQPAQSTRDARGAL